MINKIRKQSGFSLLELLLVVAVLAAISVSGVSYLREKAVNAKVDKAAVQIQQWLEASMTYYVKNNSNWPDKKDKLLPVRCPRQPKDPDYYLPCNSDLSPWYQTAGVGEYKIEQSPDQNYIKVILTIPQDADGENIAKRIASKLPIAQPIGNTVTAYANTPGQGGGDSGATTLYGFQQVPLSSCDNAAILKKHIDVFKCSGIKKPMIYLAVNGFVTRYKGTTYSKVNALSASYSATSGKPDDPSLGWDVVLDVNTDADQMFPCRSGQILVIKVCQ